MGFFSTTGFNPDKNDWCLFDIAFKTRIYLARMLHAEFRRRGLKAIVILEDDTNDSREGEFLNEVYLVILENRTGAEIISSRTWSSHHPSYWKHPDAPAYLKIPYSVGAEWQRKYWDPEMRLRYKARKNPA